MLLNQRNDNRLKPIRHRLPHLYDLFCYRQFTFTIFLLNPLYILFYVMDSLFNFNISLFALINLLDLFHDKVL